MPDESRTVDYRRRATLAKGVAQRMDDAELKLAYLILAEAWAVLADNKEAHDLLMSRAGLTDNPPAKEGRI